MPRAAIRLSPSAPHARLGRPLGLFYSLCSRRSLAPRLLLLHRQHVGKGASLIRLPQIHGLPVAHHKARARDRLCSFELGASNG